MIMPIKDARKVYKKNCVLIPLMLGIIVAIRSPTPGAAVEMELAEGSI